MTAAMPEKGLLGFVVELDPSGHPLIRLPLLVDTLLFGRTEGCGIKVDCETAIAAQLTVGESGRVYVTVVGKEPSTAYYQPGQAFTVAGRRFCFEPHAGGHRKRASVASVPAVSSLPPAVTAQPHVAPASDGAAAGRPTPALPFTRVERAGGEPADRGSDSDLPVSAERGTVDSATGSDAASAPFDFDPERFNPIDTLGAALTRSNKSLEMCHTALRAALDSQRRMRSEYEQRLTVYRKARNREVATLRARVLEARRTPSPEIVHEMNELRAERDAAIAAREALAAQLENHVAVTQSLEAERLRGRLAEAERRAERAEAVAAETEQLRHERDALLSRLIDAESTSARALAAERRAAQLAAEVGILREQLHAAQMTAEREREQARRDAERLRRESEQRRVSGPALQATLASVKSMRTVASSLDAAVRHMALEARGEAARISHALLGSLRRRDQMLGEMQKRLVAAEDTRRRLHETVMELKGNIRVFCRVRPLLASEPAPEQPMLLFSGDGQTIDLVAPPDRTALDTGGETKVKRATFTFDRVFEPDSTQEEIFDDVAQLVQSALDGFRVCIFAYGQTGSGKTYTMEGGTGPTAGVIPRAIRHVFAQATKMEREFGWQFSLAVSVLEIYNESIRDLLSSGSAAPTSSLAIKHDADGNTVVQDLTVVAATDPAQVEAVLRQAAANRARGSTNMNEHSSRSHLVFQLHIRGSNPARGRAVYGMLTLVDLAGSERLRASGSTGDRLKEAQHINKSLSSLGDVICALAAKEAHVPYRNSKLTYLLADSLGGSNKTLMIVNLSPTQASLHESLCSLRFAAKVSNVVRGQAKKYCAVLPGAVAAAASASR